ncbi:MAG TPA: sensor histidine kinase [Streptosporangiaceae bacterium]|nr:sensor histidine kinase [Streptosporangiaceae bacterium]
MRPLVRRLLRQRLSTQVVIMEVTILVITMAAGFAVVWWNLERQLYQQYEHRSLVLAETLASQPTLVNAVAAGDPGGVGPDGEVQQLAEAARNHTKALFVVITNARGVRLSHPHTWLIGTSVTYHDPEPASTEPFRTGKDWVGIQTGTLGPVAAGKAPLFDHGRLIGEVSVGFKAGDVTGRVADALPSLAAYLLVAVGLGVAVALAFARRLKRQTFGLELGEIAGLLQEREAMLHGIREGVLGYDKNGRVLLANDAARTLLRLPADFLGRPVRDMLPPGRLADVVTGEVAGSDLLVLHGDRVIVANRMPIRHDHRRHLGWVVTFHDETESESLKRQLDDTIGMTETLRAQSHDFANRLHTLVGLVELGHYDEAIRFVTDTTAARDALTEQLKAAIRDPRLVAMVLAKSSLADERGVRLRVAPGCRVDAPITGISEVLTVVGNLIDNAIEATAPAPEPRWVELTVLSAGADLLIRVRDSGPGVPGEMREAIFTDGFTSKSSLTGARRGLGLALVRQITQRRGGMVSVGHDQGAVFTAVLPRCLGAAVTPASRSSDNVTAAEPPGHATVMEPARAARAGPASGTGERPGKTALAGTVSGSGTDALTARVSLAEQAAGTGDASRAGEPAAAGGPARAGAARSREEAPASS